MSERLQEFVDRIGGGLGRIAELVPTILEDPQGYRQEAFVLAVIAALVVLVMVLVVLILIESIPVWRRRRELGYRRRWGVVFLRIGVAVVVGLGTIAVLWLVPSVPVAGRACDACHEVAPAVAAWEAGPHAGVSCYGCHARPGVVGALQAGARGAARLLGARPDEDHGAGVAERRCLDCHHEIAEGVTDGVIRMRHSDVIAAGYACLGCHPAVGHETLERSEMPIVRSRMGTCLVCHDGVAASSSCTACHDGPPSDPEVITPSARTGVPTTCDGCHTAQTERACVDCHGLVLPHPEEFMGQHARSSSRDPGLCARCHETASARAACACHVDVNVHGTYDEWFPRHGPAARTSWPGGCACHEDLFCLFCHERIP